MPKQFTKVTKTYSTKNKLQLLILNELQNIDCTLFKNKEDASKCIKKLYHDALLLYKGNAVVPLLKTHEATKNDTLFYVDDVISISIYNVQNDFS